jgi:hypothetical protein
MTIGIYKPFKPLYFVDDTLDNAAWSYEIVHMSQILADQGHSVYILSENDLNDDESDYFQDKNILDASKMIWDDEQFVFDRIIIWCGSFQLDKIGDEIIPFFKAHTPRLDFFLTDKKLIPETIEYLYMFDNIYVQSTLPIYTQDDKFGALGELLPYKHEWTRTVDEAIASKTTEFYFGGTERDRLDDFLEYVWRPGHLVTTKSQFLGIENRIDRNKFKETLDTAKYSVVITDVVNNEVHFISPRPYELYMHDIVAFFDYKYDADEHFCSKDDWRRVHNYKELRTKMNYLNENPEYYKQILEHQRAQITQDLIDGSYVYSMTK